MLYKVLQCPCLATLPVGSAAHHLPRAPLQPSQGHRVPPGRPLHGHSLPWPLVSLVPQRPFRTTIWLALRPTTHDLALFLYWSSVSQDFFTYLLFCLFAICVYTFVLYFFSVFVSFRNWGRCCVLSQTALVLFCSCAIRTHALHAFYSLIINSV